MSPRTKPTKPKARGSKATTRHYRFMPILTGSDLSRRRLPVMEVDSGVPGPVVWLTACAHGDEVGGMVVVQEVFARLRKRPLRRGRLCAFPLMNPMGFEIGMRNIPLSREDLNRAFPGSPTGSLAERVADRILSCIEETAPIAVLDLHTDWRRSIPYVVLDAEPDRAEGQENPAERLALASGLPVVRETAAHALEGTLSDVAGARGIPTITLELGESDLVNEVAISVGVGAVWNVLARLGLTDPDPDPFQSAVDPLFLGRILTYSERPMSSASGLLRFLVRPGAVVTANQPLARVYNAFGKLRETLRAEEDGLLLGYTDRAVSFPGNPVVAMAVDPGQGASPVLPLNRPDFTGGPIP